MVPNTPETLTGELQLIEQVIDSLLASSNLQDFCKALVHSDISGDQAQGSQVFLLNGNSELLMIAGYGGNLIPSDQPRSIWEDHPLGKAVRTKTAVLETCIPGEPCSILAIPVLKDQVPLGVLSICFGQTLDKAPIENGAAVVVGKIAALYLETAGAEAVTTNGNGRGSSSPEDLTSRQLTILGYMADGMVNAEIARELLLSESTIRQETVKIYRALGVAGRLEASKKARALGLIGKRLVGTPPPQLELKN